MQMYRASIKVKMEIDNKVSTSEDINFRFSMVLCHYVHCDKDGGHLKYKNKKVEANQRIIESILMLFSKNQKCPKCNSNHHSSEVCV